MPTSLKATRVLLYVLAGASLLGFVGALLLLATGQGQPGLTAQEAGQAFAFLIPGIACFIVAWRIKAGRRGIWWAILIVSILLILLALSSLAAGDPRGIVQLAIPIAIIILVSRKPARAYLRQA